jgi:chitinase
MTPYLDFYNLMGYDFAGSWDAVSGHQANLFPSKSNPSSTPFSVDTAVRYYLSHGVPSAKLVLGMPIYGRAFQNSGGMGKPYSGVGEGSWENGVWDYKALPKPGAQEKFDEESGASYSIDGSGTIVSYDDKSAVQRKTRYIDDNGLGGAMWWESSADKTGDASLIAKVCQDLYTPEDNN